MIVEFTYSKFSKFPGQTANQTSALLDSGTSTGSLPEAYLDFIYASIPGASKQPPQGGQVAYIVPCSAEPQLSFVFGSIEVPVNPIDLTGAVPDGNGGIQCQSAFFGTTSSSNPLDMILGDAFLRNAYVLFDFGTIANASNAPFVQILPVRHYLLLKDVPRIDNTLM